MTDVIATIEQAIKELKERDGIDTIFFKHYANDDWMGEACTVKVFAGHAQGEAHAKNFNLAYTKALKRMEAKQ